MSNWSIVAIPTNEDPVREISSETVPHMTLFFLGEQAGNMDERDIASFLLHLTDSSITRFGLDVDHRGTLGPKQADVLFFGEYGMDKMHTLRTNIMQNPAIQKAYDSTEQYPTWTPHLTLGYPESPAHKDERDYPGLGWVNFDRLAFWTEDFEGYEFRLKSDTGMELAHRLKPTLAEDELTHYGVPGMRWGKRKGVALTKASADHKEVTALRQKKAHELSNVELQRINNRKQLEKKYKDLNPSTVKKGQQQVAAVLAIGATIAAVSAMMKGPAGQLAKAAVSRGIQASMSNSGKHVLVEAAKASAKHL